MRDLIEQFYSQFWVIVHHRWLAIIFGFIICVIGWVVVEFLPDQYEVETKVYFDTKTVLTPLLKGLAVDNSIKENSALIMRRTLTSRPNLLKVAQENELDLAATNPKELEEIIIKLGSNIHISAVSIDKKKRSAENLYKISYVDEDPKLAKDIVESILSIFIENILGTSRKDSDKAEKFLDEKIVEYKKKLEAAEDRLKIFKQKNPGLVQERESSFFSRLNKAKGELADSKLSLREEENKNIALKKQLSDFILSSKSNGDNSNDNFFVKEKSALDERIETIQTNLDSLLLQFTEKHPDVISNKRILKELLLQKEEEELQASGSSVESSNKNDAVGNSPFYQELKLLISQSDSEIAAIKARVAEHQNKIEEMGKVINVMPEIESELVRLNRDYAIIKETYDNLVQRKASAEISREAEQTGGELQFKIIEPPRIPFKPVGPNRLMLSSIILVIGLAIGVLVAWLAEQINPTYYSSDQIQENFDIDFYGSVSMYWTPSQVSSRRIGIVFYMCIFLMLLGAYAFLLLRHGVNINISDYM